MKIFVCEYITGGGLYREDIPASLATEGLLMRDALLHDLSQLHEVAVTVAVDARFPLPAGSNAEAVGVPHSTDAMDVWCQCIARADAVWCIAPETNQVLETLYEQTAQQNKVWIGCDLQTIRLAADKWQTTLWLQTHGLLTIPTYLPTDDWQRETGPWVAKLSDGAGCEDSGVFNKDTALTQFLASRMQTHLVQPYVSGTPASLSMLCHRGLAYLLTCNQQLVELVDGQFVYLGSRINGCLSRQAEFQQLASSIVVLLPQFSGYLGVDVILTEQGTMPILELNPRLTTSYVGLHRAIGLNPAKLILDMHYNDSSMTNTFVMPILEHNTVDILLHDE